MKRFVVLLEVLYQLVVGVGTNSEATLGTCNFFGHTYRVLRVPLVNLTFVILASQIGICEKRADAKAVISMLRSFRGLPKSRATSHWCKSYSEKYPVENRLFGPFYIRARIR